MKRTTIVSSFRLTLGFKIGERMRLDLFLERLQRVQSRQLPGSQRCPEFVVVLDPHRGP
jgi:hypothetical protein